jgi:hypothetical protein
MAGNEDSLGHAGLQADLEDRADLQREGSFTVILKMTGELRNKLAINISDCPSFDRTRVLDSAENEAKSTSYLIVGGQSAADLARAMTKQGIEATSVTVEDWRVNSLNVNVLVDKSKVDMQDNKPTTVILAGLESSTYKAQERKETTSP